VTPIKSCIKCSSNKPLKIVWMTLECQFNSQNMLRKCTYATAKKKKFCKKIRCFWYSKVSFWASYSIWTRMVIIYKHYAKFRYGSRTTGRPFMNKCEKMRNHPLFGERRVLWALLIARPQTPCNPTLKRKIKKKLFRSKISKNCCTIMLKRKYWTTNND